MDPETTTPTTDAGPEWRNPFYEPHTIPAGWDVSAIQLASAPQAGDKPTYQLED